VRQADTWAVTRIITLTTDFGTSSPYVAAMKGVLLSIHPSVTLVDISHAIGPQNIREGAVVLHDAARWFPKGTIHVCVVDPGVGTNRRIIEAEVKGQHYVAPDNGLLSLLLSEATSAQVVAVENPDYRLPHVSATFHGRDIMSPVAAHLSLGLLPEALGPRIDDWQTLTWPTPATTPEEIQGCILWIDRFGNLITNIDASLLGEARTGKWQVECQGREIRDWVTTYAQRPPGTLVALVGSMDRLELAVVEGSAVAALGATSGDPVTLKRGRDA
jgi:S-adenosylmethionine hydrolase